MMPRSAVQRLIEDYEKAMVLPLYDLKPVSHRPPVVPTGEVLNHARNLLRQHFSDDEVSDQTGLTVVVVGILREVEARVVFVDSEIMEFPLTDANKADIERMRGYGLRPCTISDRTGIPLGVINQYLRIKKQLAMAASK